MTMQSIKATAVDLSVPGGKASLPQCPPLADTGPVVMTAGRAAAIVWWCRRLCLLSGLLVAGSLFLPMLHEPAHGRPILLFWLRLRESGSSFGSHTADLVFAFCGLILFYLLGALLAAGAVGRIAGRPGLVRFGWQGTRGLLVLLGAGVLWALPHIHHEAVLYGQPFLRFSSLALAAVLLGGPFLAGRRGHRGFLVEYLAVSLGCVFWFTFLVVTEHCLYGAYVCLAASLVLALATATEAVLHNRNQPPWAVQR
jgi:hypothetical protein